MFNESLINSVTVSKEELLQTLETNMGKHKDEVAGLLAARRDEIEERLAEILLAMSQDASHQPEPHHHFPEVVDHTDDYERAIAMVKMSIDETITLEEDQFKRLIMDEWHWRNEMIAATAAYGDKVPRRR